MTNGIEILYVEIYHFLHCVSIILNLASMRLTTIGLFPKYLSAKQVTNETLFTYIELIFFAIFFLSEIFIQKSYRKSTTLTSS